MLVARKRNALGGYLIYHVDGEQCVIDDLFTSEEPVSGPLLAEAADAVRALGVQTISVPRLASHKNNGVLQQSAFQARESSPVVLLTLPKTTGGPWEQAGSDWYLSAGDQEA